MRWEHGKRSSLLLAEFETVASDDRHGSQAGEIRFDVKAAKPIAYSRYYCRCNPQVIEWNLVLVLVLVAVKQAAHQLEIRIFRAGNSPFPARIENLAALVERVFEETYTQPPLVGKACFNTN